MQDRIHAEHLRIAGEKFLELSRDDGYPDLHDAAESAIRAADVFIEVLLRKAADDKPAEGGEQDKPIS